MDVSIRGGALAQRSGEVVRLTLDKMAAGGMHDQLAGGFHRYSVDERWIVPHFEKMAYDNSEAAAGVRTRVPRVIWSRGLPASQRARCAGWTSG